jgi:hypothetical protein
MPRGDGTGPAGQGPKTGRAAGYCAGYDAPGFMNPGPGRGFWGRGFWGRGGGRGRGFRRYWDYPPAYPVYPVPAYPAPAGPAPPGTQMNPEDEAKYLEGVAEQLKKELEAITKRIDELSRSE